LLLTAVLLTAMLLGAGRAAIDRYLLSGDPQQQTRRTLLQQSIARTDGQTNKHRNVT